MPPNFWNKICVESQDLGSDVAEATQGGVVPTMVEQIERNHISNTFDDFQDLIEELKNQSLMTTQHFERLETCKVN